MSPSKAQLEWLKSLVDQIDTLQSDAAPRPYYSQRVESAPPLTKISLDEVAKRVRRVVGELDNDNYFASFIGFQCIDDDNDGVLMTPSDVLRDRVGKPQLWDLLFESWSLADLCDFIEVFFDIVARPKRGYFHSFGGCGWHPLSYSKFSGERIYLWLINDILDNSDLPFRLSEAGQDRGQMVAKAEPGLDILVEESLVETESGSEVEHAVKLFRSRTANRDDKRSAILALARILELNKNKLKISLLKDDNSDLFHIANKFDLRHRNLNQKSDYDDAFLDWIFYWYLATIHLVEQLSKGDLSQSE